MPPPATAHRSRGRLPLMLLGWTLLCTIGALGAGEAFVRWRGRTDADGTFHYAGKPIRPWATPIARTRALLDEYAADPQSYLRYDADLGWSPRPEAVSRSRLYRANSDGLRAPREYALGPLPGVVRIALLGDSFVHGDDVGWDDSLAARLQTAIEARGIDAEVLNFGVGGYGFDQALLRWRRDAVRYRPDLVVQGLQLENTARNVNLFRILYYPTTTIPFSKPRFVLSGGLLQVVNRPTVNRERIVATLEHFHAWELSRYEAFYDPREYAPRWWSRSRLASLLHERTRQENEAGPSPEQEARRLDSEAFSLTQAILAAMRMEVEAAGAALHLLYLPTAPEAVVLEKRRVTWRTAMRKAVCAEHECVDPGAAIVDVLRSGGMRAAFTPEHFTGATNAAVAEVLAEHLLPSQDAAEKVLARRGPREAGPSTSP